MKAARCVAIVDAPPQITVESPGRDLTLGALRKVPLMLAVHDDFGLANVVLCVQRQAGASGSSNSPAANGTLPFPVTQAIQGGPDRRYRGHCHRPDTDEPENRRQGPLPGRKRPTARDR